MRHIRLLAKRYGLATKGGLAFACVLMIVLLATVGLILTTRPMGILVERSAMGEDEEAAQRPTAQQDVPDDDQIGSDNAQQAPADGPPQRHDVVVHVDGAVASPGVYVLSTDDPRVNDAVELAGGLTSDADTTSLNLAAALVDGQKVHVPVAGEVPPQVEVSPSDESTNQDRTPRDQGSSLININDASAQELVTLPGVGEATAAAIIEERERNGSFASVEDLMRVSGIGEKKFAKIRDLICV